MPTNTLKCLEVQLTSNIDWGTHVQPLEPRPIGHSDYSDAISFHQRDSSQSPGAATDGVLYL